MKKESDKGIQVISRAASILREVVANPDGMSLGQLATATGLARSTVQRIVDALEMEYLVQAGTRGVRPGWGLRRLGDLAGPSIACELRPQLFRLFEATGETVDLSTLGGAEVLFLDRFLSEHNVRVVPDAGAHYPAYAMATGKALLAGLDNEQIWAMYGQGTLERLTPTTLSTVDKLIAQLDVIRTGGFAYDIEEHALGSCAIGLPIGIFGTTQLAVSVVIPTERYQEQKVIIENALRLSANDFAQRIDK
ncbi:TPA: IclR family transcriptional regulator [Escherichia coli]|nr:IclR family transcriptional regulator [Escherichia coli]HCP6623559.1 IclR family transcriptional regulator [Escherichia coli]HCP6917211.1 IclR family transcriptional regulator [Escherichia coli]HCP6944642.1 IclR family transcriptional regulator [Escherichia coli]HCU6258246.1 IclR family transcriptional regulator [Escherichia coli]